MEKQLKRNITLVYGLAFFHMFMLIVPVLVPFFQSKGLSLAEVFYLQAVYAACVVILEAPSGYLADVLGRRLVLIVGAAAHGAGYLWLNFADGFIGLLIFELAMGVAVSMMSGADLALLYDSEKSLAASDSEHTYSLAHFGFLKSIAEGLGALLGGVIAMWSFDMMVVIQSVVAWVCLLLAMLIVEPPIQYEKDQQKRSVSFTEIWQYIKNGDPVLKWVFVALPVYNLATINVAWLVQPYWENMGLTLAMFGALWFAQSMTVAVASKCGYALERSKGPVFSLLMIGLLQAAAIFGMAWFGGWIGIVVGFALFFCRGLYQVILVNALNRRIPSRFRATVNSVNSLLFRFGFIITGPVTGYLADVYGVRSALLAVGLLSVLSFVFIMLPLVKAVRVMLAANRVPVTETSAA